MSAHKPHPIRGRLNSWFLAAADEPMHREYGRRKLGIFGDLPPVIVELGPGSGANFRYYPLGTHVIAVEPKFFFPGVGAVGVENTYAIYEDRVEMLTLTAEDLVVC